MMTTSRRHNIADDVLFSGFAVKGLAVKGLTVEGLVMKGLAVKGSTVKGLIVTGNRSSLTHSPNESQLNGQTSSPIAQVDVKHIRITRT
jgi:hypothetical protein